MRVFNFWGNYFFRKTSTSVMRFSEAIARGIASSTIWLYPLMFLYLIIYVSQWILHGGKVNRVHYDLVIWKQCCLTMDDFFLNSDAKCLDLLKWTRKEIGVVCHWFTCQVHGNSLWMLLLVIPSTKEYKSFFSYIKRGTTKLDSFVRVTRPKDFQIWI